jgi:Fe-S cluster assembly protein SufB
MDSAGEVVTIWVGEIPDVRAAQGATMATTDLDLGRYKLGWSDTVDYAFTPKKGINEDVVREISWWKGEPDWMTKFRLKALRIFESKPMAPWFAVNMPDLNFDDIYYYLRPAGEQVDDWDALPEQMKQTYEKLGIPEAERKYLAGVTAQYESEVVYHRNREDLEKQGILFSDMDTAVREHPEIVRRFMGKIIPPGDNKFSALNSAVWSGGSFIYVPPGVNCELPLQAYFRINAENAGQFERTLIIADEGAQVHYIEGCSAPVYSSDSLHSAVVELVAMPSSRITYTTIQNWSPNVYNLVTKRARADTEAHVEWIDGNIGSRLTMKYPSVVMVGPKASGEVLSVAYAGAGQHQDTGAKMVHAAPETTSTIISKSISKDGGHSTYRGLVHVDPGAKGAKSFVRCDALLLDDDSISETKPYMEVEERDARIGHEATVSKVGSDQLFYLMSRGLSEQQAMGMIVNGFIEPITRTLPMEYAVEWSRLIELQMEGSVG